MFAKDTAPAPHRLNRFLHARPLGEGDGEGLAIGNEIYKISRNCVAFSLYFAIHHRANNSQTF